MKNIQKIMIVAVATIITGGAYQALAQYGSATPVQSETELKRGKVETIKVVGNDYAITPYQDPNTTLTWDEAKKALPQVIFNKPAQPIPNEKVLQYLEGLRHKAMLAYDADVKALTDKMLPAFQAQNPQGNWDMLNLQIYQDVMAGQGEKYSKDIVQKFKEQQALIYLMEMIEESLGKGAPPY